MCEGLLFTMLTAPPRSGGTACIMVETRFPRIDSEKRIMKTLTMQTKIGADRCLHLHIPCDLPPGDAEVVVVVQPAVTGRPVPPYPSDHGVWAGRSQRPAQDRKGCPAGRRHSSRELRAHGRRPNLRDLARGHTVSVPCQLRPMLAAAYRQDPALARFLAAAAGGR